MSPCESARVRASGGLQRACTAHGRVPQSRSCFLSSEVECKPREQLIITPLIKAGQAPRVHPHWVQSPLIRRHQRNAEISCILFSSSAASSDPAAEPPPRQATYSGAGDPASPRRLPAFLLLLFSPSVRQPVRGSTPHRPQAGPCAPLPHESTPPGHREKFPVLADQEFLWATHTYPVFAEMGRGWVGGL